MYIIVEEFRYYISILLKFLHQFTRLKFTQYIVYCIQKTVYLYSITRENNYYLPLRMPLRVVAFVAFLLPKSYKRKRPQHAPEQT